jgi:hypothetical protein
MKMKHNMFVLSMALAVGLVACQSQTPSASAQQPDAAVLSAAADYPEPADDSMQRIATVPYFGQGRNVYRVRDGSNVCYVMIYDKAPAISCVRSP